MQKKITIFSLLFLLIVYLSSALPSADWVRIYCAATRYFLFGNSPYDRLYPDCISCVFVNPPWTLLIFLPVTILPPDISRGIIFALSIVAIIFYGWKMHARPLSIVAIFLSPTVLGSLLAGNLDILILLGVFLPPSWGLLLLMIKPQIGLGVAIFYAIESIRERNLRAFLWTIMPVTLAYLISMWLFPEWLDLLLYMPANPWNRSIFPYGIPLAIISLGLALWKRNPFYALIVGLFVSPYLTYSSYSMIQFGLLHKDIDKTISRDWLQILLSVFFWVVMLYFKL